MDKPVLTQSRDIIRRLEADGSALVSVRGSHHKYRCCEWQDGNPATSAQGLPIGTVRSIYRQAG